MKSSSEQEVLEAEENFANFLEVLWGIAERLASEEMEKFDSPKGAEDFENSLE